jgi:tripartite-type tricarboxylate transporter receptor subunit TctC
MNRRRALQALLVTTCSTLAPTPFAQEGRSIRCILPVGTASGVDSIVAAVQHALARVLGHAVAIDHQPGAGGMAGTSALVRSAPDGYTLGFVSNSHVIAPSVYRTLPFDPINDITPIAMIGNTPMVLVCNPTLPAADANELLALLKSRAVRMNFGSSGHGSFVHLASERFLAEAGAKANHVAYEGVEPMLVGLICGEVEFAAVALASVHAHLKSGALHALGVSAAQRVAAAPEIPTMAEQGLPDGLAEGWFALVAPKGLPPAEVVRLNVAAQSAFAAPEVMQAMADQGNRIRISTPQVAAEFFRTELVSYAQFVKKAGIALV